MKGYQVETRYVDFDTLEIRAEADHPNRLVGYAAVFDSETDLGPFREVIKPGAFMRALSSGKAIRALFEHDPAKLLATTANGTLTIAEDAKGLRVQMDVNAETSHGRDALALVKRGDVKGMSFRFKPAKGGQTWNRTAAGGTLRTLTDFELVSEVTITSIPAYGDTSVSMRSIDPEAIAYAKTLTDTPTLRSARHKLMAAMAAG